MSEIVDKSTPEKIKRPALLSVLSILHFFGGIAMLVIFFLALSMPEEVAKVAQQMGLSSFVLIVAIVFLAVMLLASAVGMRMGLKWAWYLSSFYYIYGVFRNAFAVFNIWLLYDGASAEELASLSRSPSYYYTKHSVRVVIHLLIFMYFYRQRTLEYFGLTALKKKKTVAVQIAICVFIVIVFSLLGAV